MVKNVPAMQETWVLSPGQEDLLEKETATHSSILAWKIPWIELDTTERLLSSLSFFMMDIIKITINIWLL